MILTIVLMVLFIWWPMMNNLYGKIVSSSQILGLIPLRIFIKNSKLAKEYEKFISQMVEWTICLKSDIFYLCFLIFRNFYVFFLSSLKETYRLLDLFDHQKILIYYVLYLKCTKKCN